MFKSSHYDPKLWEDVEQKYKDGKKTMYFLLGMG